MLTSIFRRKQNLPIVIIPLLLLVWGRFVAPELGETSFQNVALFDSPYREPLPVGSAGEPVTSHVVIIVVDGLRVDVSQQLPTLNQLREQGADRVVRVAQPSFSLPGWTVIGTGAWQEQSGFTTNFAEEPIAINTIFDNAQNAGLTTAIVGSAGWGLLYPTGVDTVRVLSDAEDAYTNLDGNIQFDQDMADLALEVLEDQPNLMLIHLLGNDNVSHGWGGTSPEALAAAQNADAQIARILDAIDLADTAVFVTADHGHLDKGGHGGWEPVVLEVPLVSAGQGIAPGEYPLAQQADIAPTVAALLGTALPAHNQGTILFDQLDMPEAEKAERAVDLSIEIAQRYDSMLTTIGDSRRVDPQALAAIHTAFADANMDETLAQTQSLIQSAYSQWDAARAERLNRERLMRLPFALVTLGIVLLYLLWWRRERWNWKAPLLGAVIYFALWNTIYFLVHRFTYSISEFNVESSIVSFITGRVIEALIALTIAGVVVAILRSRAPRIEIARDVVHTMLLVAIGLGVQIGVYYVTWGFTSAWNLPDLFQGFKYYMDLYQTTVFWPLLPVPLAALLPLVALAIAWIVNRVFPAKP